jgi:hypothetical protein
MKRYISKVFKTEKNRPIYFDDDGIPCYGAIEGDYVSAVEARPIMEELVYKNPSPVETVIPRPNTSQERPKTIFHDKDAIDFDVRKKTKKNKSKSKDLIAREKRKGSKVKPSKEYAWQKQQLDDETDEDKDIFDQYENYLEYIRDDRYDWNDTDSCTRKFNCRCSECIWDDYYERRYDDDYYDDYYDSYYRVRRYW